MKSILAVGAVFMLLVFVPVICAETSETAALPEQVVAKKLTKEQLLEIVTAQEDGIEDLSVSYTFDQGEGSAIRFIRHAFVIKGEKFYTHETTDSSVNGRTRQREREYAFNGEVSTRYVAEEGIAVVTNDPERTRRGFQTYLDAMLMRPPMYGKRAVGSLSLVAYLTTEYSTLHDELETVDGRACHVLDVGSGSEPLTRIWLDAARGCLPVRQVWYGPDRKIGIDIRIMDAVEAAPGQWFATRVTRKFTAKLPASLGGGGQEGAMPDQVLEVDGVAEGAPNIKVNSGVPDEFFDLMKRVPAGTELFMKDEKDVRKLIPVGPNLKPLGQE
jgi:hypothetical protein